MTREADTGGGGARETTRQRIHPPVPHTHGATSGRRCAGAPGRLPPWVVHSVDAKILAHRGPPDARPGNHAPMGRQAPLRCGAGCDVVDRPVAQGAPKQLQVAGLAERSPTALAVRPEETHGQPGNSTGGGT